MEWWAYNREMEFSETITNPRSALATHGIRMEVLMEALTEFQAPR